MKNTVKLVLILVFMFSTNLIFSQKLKSGDMTALKGQTAINIQYDYSNMAVGKFKSESEYVADRVAEMNKEIAGSGDNWAKSWVNDRTSKFQPAFESELNSKLKDEKVVAGENNQAAKYTLIIHTTFTEPGWNVGLARDYAHINIEVALVETAAKDKPLAIISMDKLKDVGGGFVFDTGSRLKSCYERAGTNLGKFLIKNAF
ncbi:MAG: hypothetical protein NT004_19755 [Bacteroidetes bacterium]|nr:hypothetical protein [Bacteroidota bacterium]